MKPALLESVIQQDRTGCGIASAAVLARCDYQSMKTVADNLGISVHDSSLWSQITPIQSLLATQGIRIDSSPTQFTGWSQLPDIALIALKWHMEKSGPAWHWSVFVRDESEECVLDPKKALRQNRRTDWGRMKPKWFLPVQYS